MSSEIEHGTHKSYLIGFALCIALTLLSYFCVSEHLFSGVTLAWIITALAIVQAIIQMLFFLHIGSEKGVRWNLITFLFMALVVLIIAGGSLLIMYSLNERVMPPMTEMMKR